MVIIIKKPNWDEPYKSKDLKGEDLLVGKATDGNLIYLPNMPPANNSAIFCSSEDQKNAFIETNVINNIISGKSIVLVGQSLSEELFQFARDNEYVVKEFDLEKDSNHLEVFKLLPEKNPIFNIHKFLKRTVESEGLKPTEHQINALNYLESVLLYTRYSKKETLKEVKKYLTDFDGFSEKVKRLNNDDPAKQSFEFAKNAFNYLKWDIPSIPTILRPFFSSNCIKKLNSGTMTLSEIEGKCIYIFKPSKTYRFVVPVILSYFYEVEKEINFYYNEIDFTIPDFKELITNHKTMITSTNINDFFKYDGLLSAFGTKIACHGCDINAAEYLRNLTGIAAGNNKFEGLVSPQEIVSCGHDNLILFVLSAKTYPYKLVDLAFIKDVLK